MRLALACSLTALLWNAATTMPDIRRIDFASLDYPFADPDDWPHKIEWQNSVRTESDSIAQGAVEGAGRRRWFV
jgi:hypothetical protein